MSKERRRQWGIRLDKEARSVMEKAIAHDITTRGLSGYSATSDAVKNIAERYFLGIPEKEIPGTIPNLEQRIPCEYFRRDNVNNEWVCDDTVADTKKRISASLGKVGKDDENVLSKCLAHLKKERERANKKFFEKLAKKGYVEVSEIYEIISEVGLPARLLICNSELSKRSYVISIDGKSLPCPNQSEVVDIEKVCRETINPSTKAPPCVYLKDLVHYVPIEDMESFKKEIEDKIRPKPCSAHGTPECPGVPQCPTDLQTLIDTYTYCPDRHSPETDIPLLEELEEPPK